MYTYDGNGYIATDAYDEYLSGWVPWTLDIYTNNNDGTPSQVVSQAHNDITSVLENASRVTFTYDADKRLLRKIREYWRLDSAGWINTEKYTYTYNAAGKEVTALWETWSDSQWVNFNLHTYTYSGGILTSDLEQTWDGTQWINFYLTTNIYTGNNLTNSLTQKWDESVWVNLFQYEKTYNADATLHQSLLSGWNSTGWHNEDRDTYHYASGCALPLTLLEFTAAKNGGKVILDWKTANEVNTSHFNIERSEDAINFTNRGKAAAKGTGASNNYGFIDEIADVESGNLYYRLQMVDKDGKVTYSKIELVTITASRNMFRVFPVPVKDKLYVTFNTDIAKGDISITTATGKQVYSQPVSTQRNGAQLKIDVSALKSGFYFIRLMTPDGIKSSKFIKH